MTLQPLEGLILARLLCASDGLTRAELLAKLGKIAAARRSLSEWRTELESTLEQLRARGLIERVGKARWRISSTGRAEITRWIGLETSARPRWGSVRALLAGKALDLHPTVARGGEALQVALVARMHGIELSGNPSAAKLRHALAWKALGLSSDRAFTAAAVQSVLFGRMTGAERLEPRRAIPLMAATAVGAKRSASDDIRAAAISAFVFGRGAVEPVGSEPEPTLQAFAANVLSLARQSGEDARFGSNKVFISWIWRQLGSAAAADERAFKERLVEANRLGHLRLSRADLVEAMDPVEVAASEVVDDNSTFHFVRI